MKTETFYGDQCTRSPEYVGGAAGVVVGGKSMQTSTYEVARRIFAAGSDGEAAGRATNTDLAILRDAGINVRTDTIGSRVWLDRLPAPDAYLTPIPKETLRRGQRSGPFGAPLEPNAGPSYRSENVRPQPWP